MELARGVQECLFLIPGEHGPSWPLRLLLAQPPAKPTSRLAPRAHSVQDTVSLLSTRAFACAESQLSRAGQGPHMTAETRTPSSACSHPGKRSGPRWRQLWSPFRWAWRFLQHPCVQSSSRRVCGALQFRALPTGISLRTLAAILGLSPSDKGGS